LLAIWAVIESDSNEWSRIWYILSANMDGPLIAIVGDVNPNREFVPKMVDLAKARKAGSNSEQN
jgi:hypothetical protein